MATVKSKFAIAQQVSVVKSGKVGSVVAIVGMKDGVSLDVQVGTAKRPWRYSEAELQTLAAAEKAAKAKAKAKAPAKKTAPAKPAAKAKAKAKAPAKK